MNRLRFTPHAIVLAAWLCAAALVFAAAPARAQFTFVSTHDFTGTDGEYPEAGLVQGSDGSFYGTTNGEFSNDGTVFKVTPPGTVTTLVSFTGANGAYPFVGLVESSDGNFYGTTFRGGSANDGTVFKITPLGTLTTLVNFTGANGAYPFAGLVEGSDGNFYGTAYQGGTSNDGTVFKITPSGTVTTLVNFTGANGDYPRSALVQGSDGNFYGTTSAGGASGYGTVFKITLSGTLTTLVSFTKTNGDGPTAALIQGSDGDFYGTTSGGGASDDGAVFKVTPAGVLTILYHFSGLNGEDPSGLVQGHDGNFYGTTRYGGASNDGTVFKITPSGALTTLYSFSAINGNLANSDGANPTDALIQGRDGNFYGTTEQGGSAGDGTIFGLFGPPATYGASEATTENTPVAFTVSFDDPSGKGIAGIAFPTAPAHGTLKVGAITETGTTGTVTLTYTPAAGYIGADSFTYTVTSSVVGTSAPSTVTLMVDVSAGAPTITSFSPTSGPAGTSVVITGTNFIGATVVGFRGKHAASFTVNATGTQITTTVPAGADTGQIAVLTSGGEAKSGTVFTVIKPTITSFSPASGPVGTTVVITGTNFTGATVVGFTGKHATFTVNSDGTQITTTVPSGAQTGPVAVTTPAGTVKSGANFTVTP